jgi:hypothetical protein
MKDALKALQNKIHARRQKGYAIGKEYDDISKKFAKQVYYGIANHAEMQEKRKVALRIKTRSEANTAVYSQYYPQMTEMTADEMRVLNNLCKDTFGVSFQNKKEVMSSVQNAVLFAYLLNQQKNN